MSINVLGTKLESCSTDPMTGFMRDGHCRECPGDHGQHTICAIMTAEFLTFSKERGNDLSTPRPEYQFAGLKPGDQWCICLPRWIEAYQAGKAPKVSLKATHQSVLERVSLDVLKKYALNDLFSEN